jgi:hypothetical protein
MSPVNVALSRAVDDVRTKSSADSISNGAPVLGRDAVPILPSGFPVEKKNGLATADPEVRTAATAMHLKRHAFGMVIGTSR